MSRSIKGSKGPGYEYWSKRPMAGMKPGAETKRMTHKLERLEAKDNIQDELTDMNNPPDYWEDEIMEAMYCHEYGPCQKCLDKESE